MNKRFVKYPATIFLVAVDFSVWPINAGETLVANNARGSLAVTITDAAGTDVTSTLSEGQPSIVGAAIVKFWLRGGAPGAVYRVQINAPTSDNELLFEVLELEVLR